MAAPQPSSGAPTARPVERVVLHDPRAIKALAHPARLAVIDELFAGRRLTATECGEIAGLSASAMSYHLRALEKWGIVRRSEATADGRERPWEAAGEGLVIDSSEPRASAAGEAMLVARQLDRERADILGWISSRDEEATWYDSTVISNSTFWLTSEEAKQLGEDIAELVGRVPRRSADQSPDGARRVRVSFNVVPVPEGNRPAEPDPIAADDPADPD